MEVEDQLSAETQKCAEVIKARIAPLQEKIEKMRKQEQKLKLEESEQKGKIRELTASVKLKDEQVQFYKKEAGRKAEEKQELTRQVKDLKAQVGDLTMEKQNASEDLSKEKQSRAAEGNELRRQLQDLIDRSEQEVRQKNEKIKRLEED